MREFYKDEAMELFRSNIDDYGFVERVIEHSNKLYIDTLEYEAFQNVLIFPWNSWKVFHHFQKKGLLTNSRKWSAMTISEIALRYEGSFEDIPEDGHKSNIENLKESIKSYGYMDRSRQLIFHEKKNRKVLYHADCAHRFIAYHILINKGLAAYKPLSCVYAEIDNVGDILYSKANILRPTQSGI